jgi:hypothetical protein
MEVVCDPAMVNCIKLAVGPVADLHAYAKGIYMCIYG